MTTPVEDQVCESCIEAFEEEGMPRDGILDVIWIGMELPDHICEAREDPDVRCRCTCSPHGKGSRKPGNKPLDNKPIGYYEDSPKSDVIDELIRDYLAITKYPNGGHVSVFPAGDRNSGNNILCIRGGTGMVYFAPFLYFYADGKIAEGTWDGQIWTPRRYLKGPGTELNWRYFHENADPVIHANEQLHAQGELICPACVYQSDNPAGAPIANAGSTSDF